MTKYYVYELVNLMGGIEYVGSSCNPKHRFYQHTKVKRGIGRGRFFQRQDITINVVSHYPTKKEARKQEALLQKFWGLETESEVISRNNKGKLSGEKCRFAKLTEKQVNEILVLLEQKISQNVIAQKFGVGQPIISRIKNGNRWKHLNV